jgi:glutathione S-transferase
MALAAAGQTVRLREVVLKDKPPSLLEFSPKATVPVLVLTDGISDKECWLTPESGSLEEMMALIERNDNEFKTHLDRYKYSTRYEDADPLIHRSAAETFLQTLEELLNGRPFLFGASISLADVAIAPFVRQFANADPDWFQSTPYARTQRWLEDFVESERFKSCMIKRKKWHAGDPPLAFP